MKEKSIKIYDIVLIISLIYYFLEVFVLHWYISSDSIKYVSIIIMLAIPLVSFKKVKIKYNELLIFIVFILYFLINIIITDDNKYLASEIVYYTIAPISIIYFFRVFSREKTLYDKCFKDIIPHFLNIYFFINIPILIIQAQGTGFLMRGLESSTNQFYPDHISGLLGIDGTHKLTIFTIATVIGNIYLWTKKSQKRYLIFIIIEIVFSMYISIYNDNKALYLLLPIMLLPIIFKLLILANKNKKIVKIIIAFLLIGVIIFEVYQTNETIKEEIDSIIFSVFKKDNEGNSNVNNQERIQLFLYALNNGNGYGIGMGIGCIKLQGDVNLPTHFGISDLSSRTYEGGLIYVLLWILMFSILLYNSICEGEKNLLVFFLIFMSILIFIVYEQITTTWNQTFLLGLMFMMYKNFYETLKDRKREG